MTADVRFLHHRKVYVAYVVLANNVWMAWSNPSDGDGMDPTATHSWFDGLPFSGILLKTVVVIGLYVVTSLATTWLTVRLGRAQGYQADRIRGALRSIRILLSLLFATILLIVLGVDFAAIPAFLGSFIAVVGVACFATWSVLSNVTAGLIIYATKDLHLGDLVRIGSGEDMLEGRIVEFRLWTLLLRREDGCTVIYPNNLLIQRPVIILIKSSQGRTTQLIQQQG